MDCGTAVHNSDTQSSSPTSTTWCFRDDWKKMRCLPAQRSNFPRFTGRICGADAERPARAERERGLLVGRHQMREHAIIDRALVRELGEAADQHKTIEGSPNRQLEPGQL
jgi:hypothetical protein